MSVRIRLESSVSVAKEFKMAFEFDRMKEELQVMEWEEKLFNGDPLVLRSLHGKRYYEYVYINSSTYGDDAAWGVWFKHDDKR